MTLGGVHGHCVTVGRELCVDTQAEGVCGDGGPRGGTCSFLRADGNGFASGRAAGTAGLSSEHTCARLYGAWDCAQGHRRRLCSGTLFLGPRRRRKVAVSAEEQKQ